MAEIVLIGGSPAAGSRSASVLTLLENELARLRVRTQRIDVRALPAEALMYAQFDAPAIQTATQMIDAADAVVVATPVYKAAYSGVLKAFLDLLPQRILADKVVLPIATGGSPGHLLAIDYALKPVLAALGAQHIVHGVYILDGELRQTDAAVDVDPPIALRLDAALRSVLEAIRRRGGPEQPQVLGSTLVLTSQL